MNGELPEGWVKSPAKGLFSYVTSGSRNWSKYYSEKGALFVRITNLDHGTVDLDLRDRKFVSLPSSAEGKRTLVQPNDILISITADVGMVGLVPSGIGEAYVNQHIALARPTALIDARYLAWYFASEHGGQVQLRDLQRGATKVGLALDDIGAVEVPLPPLSEQHRIVSKIESLLARVNAARERLEKVPLLLKRFRQAVLAKAFRGELVPTEAELAAREGRSFQPAADLLGQSVDTEGNELPEGWARSRLDAITTAIQYGYTASAEHGRPGPRLLRITDIQDGRVDWEAVPGCRIGSDDLAKYRVAAGDIVFARSGATTGKSFLIREVPSEAVFASYLIRVRANRELVDPNYLACFFRSAEYWAYISDNVAGNAQPNCNGSKLAALDIPLPPIAEQRRIVSKVEALVGAAAKVEAEAERQLKILERAPQAILQKAFAGELVPTEAELARVEGRSFESAAELLARLSSGGAEQVPAAKRSGGRRAKGSHAARVARQQARSPRSH